MRPGFYDFVYRTVRVLLVRSLEGRFESGEGTPIVFVANHEHAYGPVSTMASLPKPVVPWVTHQITDRTLCPAYIEDDFVRPEVRLAPPLSSLIARVIGVFCVGIMKDLKAIPVYKHSRMIAETIRASVRYLEQGRRLLVFPEIANLPFNEIICQFDTGFVGVARALFQKTRQVASFLPVAVHRRLRSLRIGEPVRFDPTLPYHTERTRINELLMERICEMYRAMEEAKPFLDTSHTRA